MSITPSIRRIFLILLSGKAGFFASVILMPAHVVGYYQSSHAVSHYASNVEAYRHTLFAQVGLSPTGTSMRNTPYPRPTKHTGFPSHDSFRDCGVDRKSANDYGSRWALTHDVRNGMLSRFVAPEQCLQSSSMADRQFESDFVRA